MALSHRSVSRGDRESDVAVQNILFYHSEAPQRFAENKVARKVLFVV
jgi:hypothetical protein